jgi:hypothetical protein
LPPGSEENLRKALEKLRKTRSGTDKRQPAAQGDLPPENEENLRKAWEKQIICFKFATAFYYIICPPATQHCGALCVWEKESPEKGQP